MAESGIVLSRLGTDARPAVEMPAAVCRRFLDRALRIHASGLKSYGLLTADPHRPGYPFVLADVVFLDPARNRRNDLGNRAAFHAQGEYFRRYEDAGFVADPAELLAVSRRIDDAGQEIVGVFHTHRRQPANFSVIDYRLHNPAFPWHLIMSLRDPDRPAVQPFRIRKPATEFGITENDDLAGSERSYLGPEVEPVPLRVCGSPTELDSLRTLLGVPGGIGTGPARLAV
jgi:proteasome lid subunit RPN8/RPN11